MYAVYLIVYGVIVTAIIGLVASWIDRKVTARVQYRVGPPFFQPFIDITKLLGKETLVPAGASRLMFFTAPLAGFASVAVVSTILFLNNGSGAEGFLGDLIVVVYLLTIPSISIMLGGFASGNPVARLGASREMKLILSYELPFFLAVCVPIIKSGYSIDLSTILNAQMQHGAVALSFSGALALLVCVFVMQAKLALVPFDIPEAEQEIIAGPLTEYSGPGLALYKLMKYMLLFTIPFFLIIIFLNGFRFSGIKILYSVIKYIGFVVVAVLIRNTNPRLRIDQAMKFFWTTVTIIAVIAVILALLGF
ncbi:MAG: respiratory chain complex I subunit 1 family protein [Spirochaetota bacterium]